MAKFVQTMPITDDILRYFAWKAANSYGDRQMFNSANFSNILEGEIGYNKVVDGTMVRMILTGRSWLDELPHDHWKIRVLRR